MALSESGHSTGAVSLKALLAGEVPRGADPGPTISSIAERIAAGGWPGLLGRGLDQSLQAVRDYLEEIRRVDIGRVDRRRRDPEKVGRLLRSLGPIGALGP